jgi:hypothetical protein
MVNWTERQEATIVCNTIHLTGRFTQTKGRRNEKWYTKQVEIETSRSVNTYIWQNRLQVKIWRNKGHCTLIKGTIYQKDTRIINLYVSNICEHNHIEQ